ncbi:MAG: redoxin domain-containing protein [Deltaproteobacteria bacterium]|nr:redoxin domain-containing protein [Deltaproteobacteria bacterium]
MPATATPRLHVLAINGGGSARKNYLSHLQHLQGLVDLLHTAGVPAERITVLAGDGSDSTPDLAVRVESIGAEYWRLRGTPAEGKLLPRLELGNSAVTGATLYPATRGSLSIWTLTVGQQLRAGDTLLLYVTDHGSKGATPEENRIVLWGSEQGLSVKELRETLETLDHQVRIVALMSQCYSGGFATLLSLDGAPGEATGRFCGFFSAKAKDGSYGCYPETRDDPKVGHSFMFLQALPATAGRFALAHELVVERDDTPDQPLRTSDLYLHGLFEQAARGRQRSVAQLADELLPSAWAQPGAFTRQAQLLDRLAARFGFASPRRQASVDDLRRRLQEWQARLDEAVEKLGRTLENLNRAVFRRFLQARAQWLASLKPAALKAMKTSQRAQLGATLVTELAAFSQDDSQGQTQAAAKEMWDAARKLAFRMRVRLAALERMALLLDSVAAAQYLENHERERAGLDRLLVCEDLVLPLPRREWPPPPPLPLLADDLAQVEMILALTSIEDRSKPAALRVGEPLPILELVPYRGEITAVGNGKPLLLFFWATWCKPCKDILPDLLALAAKQDLTVLAIAGETEADLDRFFVTARDFPALVARDPEARVPLLLGLRVVPSLVLVDGQGRVASKIVHSPRELPGADSE